MNREELNRVAQAFALVASYYQRRVDDPVLRMYAEDVADLSIDDVLRALNAYRKNPKNRTMPLPANIREIINPVETSDGQAREIAARIEGAIVKFGWSNSDLAREFIGDVGWEVVQRYGGWSHVCQSHGVTIQPATFHAQVRDQLAFLLVKKKHESSSLQIAYPDRVSRMEGSTGERLAVARTVLELATRNMNKDGERK